MKAALTGKQKTMLIAIWDFLENDDIEKNIIIDIIEEGPLIEKSAVNSQELQRR